MKTIALCLALVCGTLHAQSESLHKSHEGELILLTIPKSGSHLAGRLIYLLTGKTEFSLHNSMESRYFPPRVSWTVDNFESHIIQNAFEKNKFIFAHFNYKFLFEKYLAWHHDAKVLMISRDLRDVCVSAAHWFSRDIDADMGYKTTMDEKLMWVVTNGYGKTENSISNIRRHVEGFLSQSGCPNTCVLRFEDLVGEKGGGNDADQAAAIGALCSFLEISLTKQEKMFIARNLWGRKSPTFRKGQIGTWKEHFKPEHIKVFKENMGDLLIALGYEDDLNW